MGTRLVLTCRICGRRRWRIAALCLAFLAMSSAWAIGTPAGTVIDNSATVDFDIGVDSYTLQSNTATITVVERIDVVVTLQNPQVFVSANNVNQAVLFTVTNTGNGSEAFTLAIDSVLGGDDFDPVPAVPSIYFDTDGSGDFNVGDLAYDPITNNPALAADASYDVFIVNDIPGTVVNNEIGRSQLTASAVTGTGAPGTEYLLQGDGGVDAIVGATGAEGSDVGEYLVADLVINVIKSQLVVDQFGGSQPIPGATITYTITVELASTGTATASEITDLVPTYSTYVPDSITLNAVAISDATDADAGEFDISGAPTVVVRLGDLTLVSGVQTVVFQVTID